MCKLLGIPCYLEYKYDNCRFDAVIFDDSSLEILILVEFKSKIKNSKNLKTKQLEKYRDHGLPVVLISKSDQLEEGILEVLGILAEKIKNSERRIELENLIKTYNGSKDMTLRLLERRLLSNFKKPNRIRKND